MTKQVSLSNDAYGALKREKRPSESFSQAVMRLLRTARRAEKDPMAFVDHERRFTMTMEEHLALVDKDRAADRERPDAWDEP